MVIEHIMPCFYLSHGGGPWPWMMHELNGAYDKLDASLREIVGALSQKPSVIVIVSGHWVEDVFTVASHAHPPMIYDYYGFPDYTYSISYPAQGSLDVSNKILAMLNKGSPTDLKATLDPDRGIDHGVYSVLQPMFPNADIPVVQISLKSNYSPLDHFEMGKKLATLRTQGALILGSGLSFHNLRMRNESAQKPSREFDAWLQSAVINADFSRRAEMLLDWEKAPSARLAHPDEDHLLPLHFIAGVAHMSPARLCYHEDGFMGSWVVSSFMFS